MLNQRELKLLKILVEAEKPLSSELLSIILGTTQKTIRQNLKKIDELLLYVGARLISKTGSGYQIEVIRPKEYNVFIDNFQEKYIYSSDIFEWEYPRIKEIITLLIFSEGYAQVDEIADQLFTSRTTISKDLQMVREKLSEYQLSLVSKSNLGIIISGDEMHLRLLFTDYLNLDEGLNVVLPQKNNLLIGIGIFEIKKIISDMLIQYDILINNTSVEKCARLIQVGYFREKLGLNINIQSNKINQIKNTPEFFLAGDILQRVYNPIKFSLDEQLFITIFLLSRRIILPEDNFEIRDERLYYNLSGTIIEWLFNITNVDFTIDPSFRLELAKHLRGMIYRLEFGLTKTDIPLLDIKENNPSYEYAVLASEYLRTELRFKIPENEIAYLAYVFYDQFDNYLNFRKINLLAIFSTGRTAGKVFSDELTKNYSHFIGKIKTVEYYQLDSINVDNFDCILTDFPVSMFNVPISVHKINYLFQNKDRKELSHFFSQNKIKRERFFQCFSNELYFQNLNAKTPVEVLDCMVERINSEKDVPDNFKELILDRELISSTEKGNIVATPHALSITSQEVFIAVAILKRPILWHKEKVQLVILVSNGLEEDMPYSMITYTQSSFSNLELIYNLMKSKNFEEFMRTLKNYCK